MDKQTETEIQYIYENTPLIQNKHATIISIIMKHTIPHTKNENGIFLNIDVVSPDIIREMYEAIYNIINHKLSFFEDTIHYEDIVQTQVIKPPSKSESKNNSWRNTYS